MEEKKSSNSWVGVRKSQSATSRDANVIPWIISLLVGCISFLACHVGRREARLLAPESRRKISQITDRASLADPGGGGGQGPRWSPLFGVPSFEPRLCLRTYIRPLHTLFVWRQVAHSSAVVARGERKGSSEPPVY